MVINVGEIVGEVVCQVLDMYIARPLTVVGVHYGLPIS